MSEDIQNEVSSGERPLENRVDDIFKTTMQDIENIDKIFAQGGFLEMSVEKLGGDISWFKDVREALDNAYEQLEESHMGAVAHLQMQDESVSEEEVTERMVDGVPHCPEKCCGEPVTECTCGPDCEHCNCHMINKQNESQENGIDKVLVGELNMILQRSGL